MDVVESFGAYVIYRADGCYLVRHGAVPYGFALQLEDARDMARAADARARRIERARARTLARYA